MRHLVYLAVALVGAVYLIRHVAREMAGDRRHRQALRDGFDRCADAWATRDYSDDERRQVVNRALGNEDR